MLQRKNPLLISLFQKHIEGRQIFCWIDLTRGHGAAKGQSTCSFFPHCMMLILNINLRSVLNPALSWARNWCLWAWLSPLGAVWCSCVQKSLPNSWLRKKMEGSRERKPKQLTLGPLPRDRSAILPWPQKFTEEVGESEMHQAGHL